MAMCADPEGIIVKRVGGAEAHVFEAARAAEQPEPVDPEREEQVRADEAALEAWLRARGGQPWFEGIVMECVERFPGLDRFQVSAVIYKLGNESAALLEKERAEASVREHGFDIQKVSGKELDEFLEAYLRGPDRGSEVWEGLKRRYGNQQGEKEEAQGARTDAEAGQACERVADR
jgi:hypothetical protein